MLPVTRRTAAGLVTSTPDCSIKNLPPAYPFFYKGENNAFTFQVLSDQRNTYARQCGLVYTLAEELRPFYRDWGVDLPTNNGDTTFELPLPVTYVVDRDARIVLSFVDADYTRRLEPSAVLDALNSIVA